MKKIGVALIFGALVFAIFSFTNTTNTISTNKNTLVNWLTWEEALEKNKIENRKIVVDVYTEWCGWCKRMDKATFQQPLIAEYLNEHYYAVKFDAEYKEDIAFNGKTYKFVKGVRRGYHELAAEITRGRLSYPTIVFLDEDLNIIQPLPGYKDPLIFEQIMTYFAQDMHKKTPWEAYQRNYQPITPVKN